MELKLIPVMFLCLLAVCWSSPMTLVKRQVQEEQTNDEKVPTEDAASEDVPSSAVLPRAPPPPRQPSASSGSALTYKLADGAELILGNIKSTFSCNDRIYGYYADIDNNCKIFHVCVPVLDEKGSTESFMYSFFCGNLTVFDQNSLTCVHEDDGPVCADSSLHYDAINSRFGQTDADRPAPRITPTQAPIRVVKSDDSEFTAR